MSFRATVAEAQKNVDGSTGLCDNIVTPMELMGHATVH